MVNEDFINKNKIDSRSVFLEREYKIKKVRKRDGKIVDFDPYRIYYAIERAMKATGKYNKEILERVTEYVINVLEERFGDKEIPSVEQIQDIVELSLLKFDLYEVAKAYITYRKEKEKIRQEKINLLGKFYEEEVAKRFSINSIRLMVNRYLLRDENKNLIEGPKQMFERVAALIIIPDLLYDERVYDKEGKQSIKPKEDFNPTEYEYKIGLKKENGDYKLKWNRYHLERMKYLYDYLNERGHMKVKWSEFLEMIKRGEFDSYYENYLKYFDLMATKKFMPNSPTLFNAGAVLGQLAACFVLDIEDDMESIMKSARDAALIFKSGGGIGVNYSKLRPEGDVVASTGGVASGPISFMRIIDTVTDVVKQGGKRRGANMGILESWHPDILKFIHAKEKEGILENFNISVMFEPNFWKYYEENKPYPLINPRILRKYNYPLPGDLNFDLEKMPKEATINYVDPKQLLSEAAYIAWEKADPGCLFMDNINKRNVQYKYRGSIRATNPCGEQPLYPYESCNLGSINLYAMIDFKDGKAEFNWEKYIETIKWAYRFLDNVIDVNKYPLKEIEEASKAVRRVGLGFMGLADTLFALGIPYSSEEGFELIRKVSEYLTYYAMLESVERAKTRDKFSKYDQTTYKNGEMPVEGYYHKELWTLDWEYLREQIIKYGIRNVEVTSVAPTGSISMLADTSSGIEPQYALVYEKRVTAGVYYYVDPELERQLKEKGLYNDEILKKISDNGGSLLGIKEIPDDLKLIFLTALDIPWWDHIRAQAVAQLWITTSISKTINMPNWVTLEDVLNAYIFAYKAGCKGITIYREGSKSAQVYYAPSEASKERLREYFRLIKEGKIKNKTIEILKDFRIKIPAWYDELLNNKENKDNFGDIKVKIDLVEPKITPESINNNNIERCPVCGSTRLKHEGGCVTCLDCGWSECVIA
ncbi:MAG: adenosylcobalamin-dependent ribonucleoside-diphosphate reductase [Nanopusillaceae archaeon]|jgi:ribonucleoside-diphosphate reductase alpha chain